MNNKISIIGLGYVGLPLAMAACKAGYFVSGIDTDELRIEQLLSGVSGIVDVPEDVVRSFVNSGSFKPSTDFTEVAESKVVLICVPTPVKENNLPNLDHIEYATREVAKNLGSNTLVILESTVGPGTTRDFVLPILENVSGLSQFDFYLSYSPERIDPSNQNWNLYNTPKIVSGLTDQSRKLALDFYGKFVKNLVPVDSLEIAETAKLLENTFRLVNISFINELSQFCQKLGISIESVINAAATKPYGYMPFYPSLGVGGHCIPVDPLYLSHKANQLELPLRFIEIAMSVNGEMPIFFTNLAEKFIGSLRGKRILVIGVAYKIDVPDVRQTPARALIDILRSRGALVSWHDELVKEWSGEKSVPLNPDFDLAILVTPHSYLDLTKIGDLYLLNTRG